MPCCWSLFGLFTKNPTAPMSPRVTEDLRAQGVVVNEKRVARLMRENEIASEAVKKFKITTTDSNHDLPVAERIFETEHADKVLAPNQVWAGDITSVATDNTIFAHENRAPITSFDKLAAP